MWLNAVGLLLMSAIPCGLAGVALAGATRRATRPSIVTMALQLRPTISRSA